MAERNASSVAGALINILKSPDLYQKLHHNGLDFMQKRPADLEYSQCAAHIEAMLAGEKMPWKERPPLYEASPFSAYLQAPPPQHPKTSTSQLNSRESASEWMLRRIQENRIARVLKVMWRGYY